MPASEVLRFHLHLDVIGMTAAMILAFEYGIRRLAPEHAPRGEPVVTRRHRLAFYSGVGSLFLVSTWPIHDIGEQSLFLFHMIEHLVFGLVAPPLLLYGIPWWLLRLAVKPILPALRILTKPIVALVLFNGVLAAIHAPVLVDLMLTSETAHLLIHTALFVTGILMWWPVIGPIPDLPRLEPFPRMGYLFLQSLVPTIPASFLTLGESPLYHIYTTMPRLWGVSALSDQVAGGLIMKIGGGLILWGFITVFFFRWWKDEQQFNERAPVAQSS
jgi:putative membrane protein